MHQLVLLTRRDCHLCEDMARVIDEVGREVSFELSTVDVDSAPELGARYGDEVPVLIINGRKAFKYHLSAGALRRRLRSEAWRRRVLRWRLDV
jgi:glutaredoxin